MSAGGRPLEAGERVLLVDARERRYLVTLRPGDRFHSHLGSVAHDDIIGSPQGRRLRTSGGSKIWVFRPTLADFQLKMRRGAQVVYPKDVGLILVFGDIFPGATVVEAGAGSGALTMALARAVWESGMVISYETREDHHARALSNIESWYEGLGGKPDNVEVRLGDVFEGVPERGIDRIVLDLPEPWRAVGTTTTSLAPGGLLCCYLPTIPQVMQAVDAMNRGGFGWVETMESLLRTWNVEGQSVRPDHRMVAHTGFIVVGRKLSDEQIEEAREERG